MCQIKKFTFIRFKIVMFMIIFGLLCGLTSGASAPSSWLWLLSNLILQIILFGVKFDICLIPLLSLICLHHCVFQAVSSQHLSESRTYCFTFCSPQRTLFCYQHDRGEREELSGLVSSALHSSTALPTRLSGVYCFY